jgi:hypothetical protein
MTRKPIQQVVLGASAMATPFLALAQDTLTLSEGEVAVIESFNRQAFGAAIALVVIIVAALVFASVRDKRRQEFLARFVDKEQPIPTELMPGPASRQRELRRGVWLLSVGLGLGLVLYITTTDWRVAAWSLILLFLAAASFVNAAFFYPDSDSGRPTANGD